MHAQMGNAEIVNRAGNATFRLKLIGDELDLMWKHCDIASEFLGKFHAENSAGLGVDANEMKHSISYVANELLENAVKFASSRDIELETGLEQGQFLLRISNTATQEVVSRFQDLIAELDAGDPGMLLIERIEANAENPDLGTSGLGLLTLMSDYGVELGWKFAHTGQDGTVTLETHVGLPLN